MIGALVVGGLATALLGTFELRDPIVLGIARPDLYRPEFSWAAMVELVLPLTITVLAAQNAQGKPPVNAITAACGLGSLIAALVGSESSCLTGPVNAIISSAGERDRHYAAGVAVALLALMFGIFAPLVTQLMLATPKAFIATLAGLALLRVLERAFATSFRGGFVLGATVCFLVTVANVPILSIGAPFWAVLIGLAVSWVLERADFERL